MPEELGSLSQAIEVLTLQVQSLPAKQAATGTRNKWDAIDRYRNINSFSGNQKECEEFAAKLRSQVAAGDPKVEKMMRAFENDCTKEKISRGKYDDCSAEFDEPDEDFIIAMSSEMYNLLFSMTTDEANAMVRTCQGQG